MFTAYDEYMLSAQKSYHKLALYQKSRLLVLEIYKITLEFPKTETFTLVPQMRRSAISVLANIGEGYAKESSAEFARFLTISIGSLVEMEIYVDLSKDLGFINSSNRDRIAILLGEVKKLLYGTRKAVRNKI